MTPEEQIKELRALLAASEALCLHRFKQLHEDETRSWDDLVAEEQEALIWYAEHLLEKQHPELFAKTPAEGPLKCFDCGARLSAIEPVLGSDRVYRIGTIYFDPGDPGGREEPPSPAMPIFLCAACDRFGTAKS
jgi:hypothetical protein